MGMHPQFLALITCMILVVSVLVSGSVPWWRLLAFLIIGSFGLWSISGASSILGPR